MPYRSTIGRFACRIHLPFDPNFGQSARTCYSDSRGNVFGRTWPTDAAEVAAAAAFHGSPFRDLLCIGCTRWYDRLVTEGKLP